MTRPVHAVLRPPGRPLFDRLAAALHGDGPAICPLSPDLPTPALRAVLHALRPAAVETQGGITAHDTAAPGTDAAVLIATSGSTGSPKIAELTADALLHSARATLTHIRAAPRDRWLCCLPTAHIAGLQVLVRAIAAGTEPIIHARFDPAAAVSAGAQHVSVVPTQLHRILARTPSAPSAFSSILLGGAAVPPGLLAQARAAGGNVITTYGMTETSGGCVYDGRPLDGVSMSLADDGRIHLAGPMLFSRYRLRPELTAAALDHGWFRTGDLGTIKDGRLHIRGRADDVINTGGLKVVPGEVERALRTHPRVRDAVVVGRPDPEWGEQVTAFIVATEPVTLAELRDHVRARLPAGAAPRALELLTEIPLLDSGKPDRVRLRRGL